MAEDIGSLEVEEKAKTNFRDEEFFLPASPSSTVRPFFVCFAPYLLPFSILRYRYQPLLPFQQPQPSSILFLPSLHPIQLSSTVSWNYGSAREATSENTYFEAAANHSCLPPPLTAPSPRGPVRPTAAGWWPSSCCSSKAESTHSLSRHIPSLASSFHPTTTLSAHILCRRRYDAAHSPLPPHLLAHPPTGANSSSKQSHQPHSPHSTAPTAAAAVQPLAHHLSL
jgi:hypothetical protein